MICLVPGILGFLACCIFDINKIRWKTRIFNSFFLLGSLLLIVSSIWCVVPVNWNVLIVDFSLYKGCMLAGLIGSCIGLAYALFFSLPFNDTYKERKHLLVVDQGLYGICRHPGFWMLALVYFFLWQFFGNEKLMYAFFVFNLCNLLYIIVQDAYIFPRYMHGYQEYKKRTPFLIPTMESIKHMRGR